MKNFWVDNDNQMWCDGCVHALLALGNLCPSLPLRFSSKRLDLVSSIRRFVQRLMVCTTPHAFRPQNSCPLSARLGSLSEDARRCSQHLSAHDCCSQDYAGPLLLASDDCPLLLPRQAHIGQQYIIRLGAAALMMCVVLALSMPHAVAGRSAGLMARSRTRCRSLPFCIT